MTVTSTKVKGQRRENILQVLAGMLEKHPGARITTAELASAVGVSEAALYKHFPSKARMFEGLLAFIEDSIFTRITRIVGEPGTAADQCEKIVLLVLGFAEKNPGLSRILNGDALSGEHERLRQRVNQIHERLETQLRQILREAEIKENLRTQVTVTATAAWLQSFMEGRIGQYVRSDFRLLPLRDWPEQWQLLRGGLFR
ncbi:MAG TPA: nucleoid occlusion factor SlmA [Candidatus Acidoferrum sp.]|nr:nucleoid occlusion factor SlmA [Candidatus Acidoferrum sp.]